MHHRRPLAIAAVILLAFAAVGLTTTTGSHDARVDERIVHPYNMQVMMHYPVVAGYEVIPPPQQCGAGGIDTEVLSIYQEDFEGAHDWSFVGTTLSMSSFNSWNNNLWSVTTYPGTRGTDAGYEGRSRLYFGLTEGSRAGTYNSGHPAGAAESPTISLPSVPSVLTFATKWEMEYLIGYDHMFIEMEAEDGTIHLLCHANSLGRVDEAGVNGNSAYQSCSPFLANPCPTYVQPGTGSEFPAWETRHVNIPQALWGQDVKLRFTFDASDGAANWFHGWSVTDVAVGAPLEA